MKKWDKWKKRILAFVVTGCMLLDSDMAVLAEETQKAVSYTHLTLPTILRV